MEMFIYISHICFVTIVVWVINREGHLLQSRIYCLKQIMGQACMSLLWFLTRLWRYLSKLSTLVARNIITLSWLACELFWNTSISICRGSNTPVIRQRGLSPRVRTPLLAAAMLRAVTRLVTVCYLHGQCVPWRLLTWRNSSLSTSLASKVFTCANLSSIQHIWSSNPFYEISVQTTSRDFLLEQTLLSQCIWCSFLACPAFVVDSCHLVAASVMTKRSFRSKMKMDQCSFQGKY